MVISDEGLLNADLDDGMYTLQYEWKKYGRGRTDFLNTEEVLVKDKKICIDTFLSAAEVYRIKSGLLDDIFIEEVIVYGNGVIGYITGS